MPLSLTQTVLVRIVAGQAITNNLLRLLALSPSVSISGSVATADIADGAVTPAKTTPGAYFYAADAANTNAYVGTFNPAVGAYANGLQLLLKVSNANTSAAAASLNANGLGVKNIYHRDGQTPKAGDIPANAILHLVYNSSHNGGAGGFEIHNVTASATIRPATNDTGGTANAQTVVNTPPMTAYQIGQLLLVRAGSGLTNSAAMTLNCDGLGTRNVTRSNGETLQFGDWRAGETHLLYDDGTRFILLTRDRPAAIVASCRNLVIQSTSTTQATVAADEVLLKYGGAVAAPTLTNGAALLLSSVSVTVDITLGVALNGFETGSARAVSRWYYVWLISDGTNARAVLEDAGVAGGAVPAGPDLSGGAFAGYVYLALVGQIRLNSTGSGEIVQFLQYDRQVWTGEQVILQNSTKGTVDTWQILDDTGAADHTAFLAAVPVTAKTVSGFCGCPDAEQDGRLQLAACASNGAVTTTSLIGLMIFNLSEMVGTAEYGGFGSSVPFSGLPVRGGLSRNIQWQNQTLDDPVSLSINGYTF